MTDLTSAKCSGCKSALCLQRVTRPCNVIQQRLSLASGGYWKRAEVVGGKQRLFVVSRGCWWQAEVVGGKQRLSAASRGCWWQAETVGGEMRLLVELLVPEYTVFKTKYIIKPWRFQV